MARKKIFKRLKFFQKNLLGKNLNSFIILLLVNLSSCSTSKNVDFIPSTSHKQFFRDRSFEEGNRSTLWVLLNLGFVITKNEASEALTIIEGFFYQDPLAHQTAEGSILELNSWVDLKILISNLSNDEISITQEWTPRNATAQNHRIQEISKHIFQQIRFESR